MTAQELDDRVCDALELIRPTIGRIDELWLRNAGRSNDVATRATAVGLMRLAAALHEASKMIDECVVMCDRRDAAEHQEKMRRNVADFIEVAINGDGVAL